MTVLHIMGEVLVAAFAVVGAYLLLREVLLGLMLSREITAAVILHTEVDEITLDILLDEAMRAPARRRGRRVALVIDRRLLRGRMGKDGALAPDYAAIADRYRAEVVIADVGTPG